LKRLEGGAWVGSPYCVPDWKFSTNNRPALAPFSSAEITLYQTCRQFATAGKGGHIDNSKNGRRNKMNSKIAVNQMPLQSPNLT